MAPKHDSSLTDSLSKLSPEVATLLEEHAFDPEWLSAQVELSRTGARKNEVDGELAPLLAEDIRDLPEVGSPEWIRFEKIGSEALRNGECALAVLAGGMATRMGGVVKALVPATSGKTFLELRLAEQASLGKKYGKTPPLFLMTSHATHEGIAQALGDKLDGEQIALFRQGLSVRLTEEGEVFRTQEGEPSLHAPGHGDFPDCLRRSGLLKKFVDRGGKYLLVTNLDNLGGGLDPVLIGMHLESVCAVTCEVVNKEGSDRGGIPVRLDDRPVILEEFRLPDSFDPTQVSVFNVNSFAFNADALLNTDLSWTFFEVRKKVEERVAIQYERLINEVTSYLPTEYLRVPRHGAESRFLPIKDHNDLSLRKDELSALAAARGMIETP